MSPAVQDASGAGDVQGPGSGRPTPVSIPAWSARSARSVN